MCHTLDVDVCAGGLAHLATVVNVPFISTSQIHTTNEQSHGSDRQKPDNFLFNRKICHRLPSTPPTIKPKMLRNRFVTVTFSSINRTQRTWTMVTPTNERTNQQKKMSFFYCIDNAVMLCSCVCRTDFLCIVHDRPVRKLQFARFAGIVIVRIYFFLFFIIMVFITVCDSAINCRLVRKIY